MTYTVVSEWVRFFLSVAQLHGQDPEVWLRSRGYDPRILEEPRVPFELEQQLFFDMQQQFPNFGVLVANEFETGTFARLAYSMRAAPSLDAALDVLIVLSRAFSNGYRFVRTSSDGGVEVSVVRVAPGDVILESMAVFLMSRVMRMSRSLLDVESPHVLVRFRHRRRGNAEEMRRLFGENVHYVQPRDSITFRAQDLDKPNPHAEPPLAKILHDATARQLESLPEASPVERIRGELSVGLVFGVPSASEVATRVGISTRTMNRQLAEAGTSFSQLLQSMRFDRAQAWLDVGESSSTVAALVHYSEVAAFFRAYKRHFGRNPSAEGAARSR